MASHNASAVYYIPNEHDSFLYPVSPSEAIVSSTSDMIYPDDVTNAYLPVLEITIQPMDKHRFRYKSESGSHGGITGEGHSRVNKAYPTVKLQNHQLNLHRKIFIKVSLYTSDNTNPKPHVLELVGKTCKDGTCYQKLDSKTHCAKFQGISILNKTKHEVLEILRERRKSELNVMSLDESLLEETQEEAKNLNLNAVKLCFEAVFEDNLDPVPGFTKILSNTIFNLKSTFTGDLRICRLSMCTGKSIGGEDIILLCNKIKKEEIEIKFIEKDESDNVLWTATANFNPVDVHHQVAIPFKTPKYEGNSLKEGNKVVVWIQLFRKSDEKHGDPVQFTYVCDTTENSKKRKLCSTEEIPFSSNFFSTFSDSDLNAEDLNTNDCLFDGIVEMMVENPCSLFGNIMNSDSSSIDDLNTSFPEMVKKDAVEANYVVECGDDRIEYQPAQRGRFPSGYPKIQMSHTSGPASIESSLEDRLKTKSLYETVKIARERKLPSKEKFSFGVKNLLKDKNILYYSSKTVTILDSNGNSLLHLAIMDKNPELIYGALKFIKEDLVNHKNLKNETPLHLATSGNYAKVLKLLLHHGGNPYLADRDGNNCLHLASILNFTECMHAILPPLSGDEEKKYSFNINELNFDGLAPIHLSIIHNSKECMKLLLNAKADINIAENKSGKSPLHLAVELRSSFIDDLLSQPDIDVDREDYNGCTALQNACKRHNVPYESLSFETKSDKQQIALILKKFFEKENEESDSSYHSASESLTESESSDEDEEFEGKVENFLNCNMNWKKLGPLLDMDEDFLEKLGGMDKTPAKRLIKKIKESNLDAKEEFSGNAKKTLLCILKMVGLDDAFKRF